MPTPIPASVFTTSSLNPFSLAVTDDKRSFEEIDWEEEDELIWHNKLRSDDEESAVEEIEELDEGEGEKNETDAQVEAEVDEEVDDSEDEEGSEDGDGCEGQSCSRYAVDIENVNIPSDLDVSSDEESVSDSSFHQYNFGSTYSTPPTSVPPSARCSQSPFIHSASLHTTMRRSTRIQAQATKTAAIPVPISSRARNPKASTLSVDDKGKGKAVDRSFLSSPLTSGKKRRAPVDSEDDDEHTTDKPVKKRTRKAGGKAGGKVSGKSGGKRATAIPDCVFRRLQVGSLSGACVVCKETIVDEKMGDVTTHMSKHLPPNALTSKVTMGCLWGVCKWVGVGSSFVRHVRAKHLGGKWRCLAFKETKCDGEA